MNNKQSNKSVKLTRDQLNALRILANSVNDAKYPTLVSNKNEDGKFYRCITAGACKALVNRGFATRGLINAWITQSGREYLAELDGAVIVKATSEPAKVGMTEDEAIADMFNRILENKPTVAIDSLKMAIELKVDLDPKMVQALLTYIRELESAIHHQQKRIF